MPVKLVLGIIVALILLGGFLYGKYKSAFDGDAPDAPDEDNCDDISEEPKRIPDDFVSGQCVTHLRAANIQTLYHLNQLSKEELMDVKYIGEKRADEIRSRLEDMDRDDFFRTKISDH